MRAKVPEIVKLIEHRLKNGAYASQGLPSQRVLAAELGVSYMTARRAVQEVIRKGGLPEGQGGRVTRTRQLQIALLSPVFESPSSQAWREALDGVVSARKGLLRPVCYTSWSDPIITETLDGDYDGIFMVPPSLPRLPRVLMDRLSCQRHRLVTLFQDYTSLGIPCVDEASPLFLHKIAAHLAELGHTRVACLNSEPMSPLIQQRVAAWERAAESNGFVQFTYNEAVQSGQDAGMRSYEAASRILDAGDSGCTAYFCTSTEVARGFIRAAYEHDIQLGRDISLCTCDSPQRSRLMVPTLTTLSTPGRDGLLNQGLQWLMTRGENWNKPLYIHPDDVSLWIGESTGVCPKRSI